MEAQQWTITGRVRDKETGRGVEGLHVRAYDRDLLFDDLVGAAVTDATGSFVATYADRDFREFVDRHPDISLRVFAPPSRLLAKTEVRRRAGRHEHFDIEIDHELLGRDVLPLPGNQVEGGVSISPSRLTIEERDGFDFPRLPGFVTTGRPGRRRSRTRCSTSCSRWEERSSGSTWNPARWSP